MAEELLDSAEAFREAASRLSNWGRWGPDDELGTLNFIDDRKRLEAASMVRKGISISLGADFGSAGPQGTINPLRINPLLFMVLDGGDADALEIGSSGSRIPNYEAVAEMRAGDIMRFNEDYVVMPTQASTQWDALSHIYYGGRLYNGYPASSVTSLGARHNSICRVGAAGGIVSRGVLLDIPRFRGVEFLPSGPLIGPNELSDIADAQQVEIRSGDVLLIRTGWAKQFRETGDAGNPGNGLSWHCCEWLWSKEIGAIAADNQGVEGIHLRECELTSLPMHLIAQRDMGLHMGELFDLEALAEDCDRDGVYECMLVAPPIRFVGAVASPLNPLALK